MSAAAPNARFGIKLVSCWHIGDLLPRLDAAVCLGSSLARPYGGDGPVWMTSPVSRWRISAMSLHLYGSVRSCVGTIEDGRDDELAPGGVGNTRDNHGCECQVVVALPSRSGRG